MSPRRLRAAVCGLLMLSVCAPSAATASPQMETGIADDAQVLYSSARVAARTVTAWQHAGIDVVRLQARWAFIAPHVHGRHAPAGFDPRDPRDRLYNFGALDRAVNLLIAAGIQPMVTITGSGPVWGTRFPERNEPRFEPDPKAFGDFAHAVAARYKGLVHRYIIWNEPNQAAWLKPQFRCNKGRCEPRAPVIYRSLFRKSSAEIRSVDPGAQILMGALAPRGHDPLKANVPMRPLQFVRVLGCVTNTYHRVRAGACGSHTPLTADGFAYHPHPILMSPTQHARNPDDASIGDLHRLERVLDRTTVHGILRSRSGTRLPLYLTEFGYQTNPPDRQQGVSPAQQLAWVQQAYFIAFRDPRVRSLTNYLWRDEPVKVAAGGAAHYASWQSGDYFADGRAKPLRAAFDNPFFVDVRRGGQSLFWGQVRPLGAWTVSLQRNFGSGWRTIARVRTNASGYWTYPKRLITAATYRFQYAMPRTGHSTRIRSSTRQYVGAG